VREKSVPRASALVRPVTEVVWAANGGQTRTARFRCVKILTAAVMAAIGQSAYAGDLGQWAGYQLTVEQKAWFKRMHDGNGIGCCDSADGYPVEYEMRKDGYWVHFNSVWLSVPEGAILRQPNPIGTAVAWFWEFDGDIEVRCFIPGPER
jgi:hypothetical protein